jgi:hypothetical protein
MTDLNNGTTTLTTTVRVGRLAAHLDGFAARLADQGYDPVTIRQKDGLLEGFSLWMEEHDVQLNALGRDHAGQFLAGRRRRVRRGEA